MMYELRIILCSLKLHGFLTIFNNFQVKGKENIYDTLKWLAHDPRKYVTKYEGDLINGCIFLIKSIENLRATQNSGVSIDAQTLMRSSAKDKNPISQTTTYYGVIQEIIILDYYCVKYPLFKYDWVDVHKKIGMKVDEIGFTMVNLKRCLSKDRVQDDPFILASQAKQVFYIQYPVENYWYVVMTCPPKGLRNSNTYELEYADLSSVVDFEGTK
jgi:hypothetical protein